MNFIDIHHRIISNIRLSNLLKYLSVDILLFVLVLLLLDTLLGFVYLFI